MQRAIIGIAAFERIRPSSCAQTWGLLSFDAFRG